MNLRNLRNFAAVAISAVGLASAVTVPVMGASNPVPAKAHAQLVNPRHGHRGTIHKIPGDGSSRGAVSLVAPGNSRPAADPVFDCHVNFVRMLKAWLPNPPNHVTAGWHRDVVGEVTCSLVHPPKAISVQMGIAKMEKGKWVPVGYTHYQTRIPSPDRRYALLMPCVQGKFRGELGVWGTSSDGNYQPELIFHGSKILKITDCSKPPGHP